MKLFDVAFASRIYQHDYDEAYERVCNCLGQDSSLNSEAELDCLLQFLNDWNCRIPADNFPALKTRLREWAFHWVVRLPHGERDIRSLSEDELTTVGEAYQAMLTFGAGLNFQDTAAGKALHAMRSNVLPMWDSYIKERFIADYGQSEWTAGKTYSEFARHTANKISALEEDVVRLGYSLGEVPQLVGAPTASLVKLVDEYHWVTITRAYVVPTAVISKHGSDGQSDPGRQNRERSTLPA